jgi:antitoxin FitA
MSKTIQIRNVPEKVHRTLKARAAEAGMSLSEYVLAELRDLAAVPTQKEMFERLASRPVRKTGISAASAVRKERDSA